MVMEVCGAHHIQEVNPKFAVAGEEESVVQVRKFRYWRTRLVGGVMSLVDSVQHGPQVRSLPN